MVFGIVKYEVHATYFAEPPQVFFLNQYRLFTDDGHLIVCRREMKSGIRQTDLFPLAFEFKMVDAATLKIMPAIK